jgi:hypothetical protein
MTVDILQSVNDSMHKVKLQNEHENTKVLLTLSSPPFLPSVVTKILAPAVTT